MNKKLVKYGFSLVELLLCIVVIGILSMLMMHIFNDRDMNEKKQIASAYKAVNVVNQASINIKGTEPEMVPTGNFIEQLPGGTYQFSIYSPTGETATAQDVLNLYKNYLKFDKTDFSFCSKSGNYCSEHGISEANVVGAKIAGSNIYLGFEVTEIQDCPEFRHIGSSEEEISKAKGKCWGKLYIDTNGEGKPNELGKDIYVFGLDANGVALQSVKKEEEIEEPTEPEEPAGPAGPAGPIGPTGPEEPAEPEEPEEP